MKKKSHSDTFQINTSHLLKGNALEKSKIQPKLIAHRGASFEAPENTMSAIYKAIDIGVSLIEFDVRMTKDGIPIIMHDETVSRTTDSTEDVHIEDLTFDQIKHLDAGSWFDAKFSGEKIPTLEDVLKIKLNQTGLMIEIKNGKHLPSKIVKCVLQVIENSKINLDNIIVGSLSLTIIDELIKQAPHLNIIGITENADHVSHFLNNNIKLMALWHPLIDHALIEDLHNKNVEVWSFTVDHLHDADRLHSCATDGLITNHPRLIKTKKT